MKALFPAVFRGVSGEVSEGMVPMLLDLCSNGRLTSAAGSQAATRAAGPDETAVGTCG